MRTEINTRGLNTLPEGKEFFQLYNNNITERRLDVNVLDDNKNWQIKKLNSIYLSESYKRLNNKKSYRVAECGSFLEFKRYINDRTLKLNQANFCKVRLCPMCSWRRSLKIFGQVSKVMDHALKEKDYRFIFLTLTCKNVEGEQLSNTIDSLFKGFDRLFKRKAIKQSVKGWFRALEITHNTKEDTYHPHFHCVLMVNKSYFNDKNYYISQDKWTSLWKDSLKIDYTPIVDVRSFKSSSKSITSKSVAEVAKYSVKDSDLIVRDSDNDIDEEMTDSTVNILDKALNNRRLTAFGGELRKIHKLLNLDNSEDGDLVHTDNDESIREDLEFVIERYSWSVGYGQYREIK